jgi:2-polyprenyl-6-methoxyphenol hydroxylase-like FAD-dependent oxidoreductase
LTSADDAIRDVAVIGGGLAGAAACVALSRAGLADRTVWFAPDQEPGHGLGDRVGESLPSTAEPILAQLGLSDLLATGHRPANATFTAWGRDGLVERNAIVQLRGPGWVLDRSRFEADLRARAQAAVPNRTDPILSATADDGVWTLTSERAPPIRVRALIDATGRASAISRGIADLRRDDRMAVAYAFPPHRDPTVDPTPATLIEAVADGWWYAALLPDQRLSLAYFSDPDLMPRGVSGDVEIWRDLVSRSRHIARWIEDAGFALESAPRVGSAGTTWIDPPAGVHQGAAWMAIGDAAAAFDPLSSHGMTTALWSGARVVDALTPWLANGEQGALTAYADAVGNGVRKFRADRALLYGRERRFTGRPFWDRRSTAPVIQGANISKAE